MGLALVTSAVSLLVHRTTHNWFEKDLRLRAELAVTGARQALVAHWRKEERSHLRELLGEMTHDERVMAAAACTDELTLLTRTKDFPAQFTCKGIGEQLRPASSSPGNAWKPWHSVEPLPGGSVHLSAIPVSDGGAALGFVALVHDLSFVDRREGQTRMFVFGGFGLLAIATAAITLIMWRLSRRSWASELRQLLKSGRQHPEFQPILRDVRELVDRIVSEKEADREGGAWTPQRLKQTLNRHLHGEKVVIVANREPYIHERTKEGELTVVHPASGLVTALEPVMRACSGTWVAHGSGSGDRQAVDRHGRVRVPPGEESYVIRRVWLTPEEETGYYYGFSNEGLWPLCHVAHTRPIFRSEDWQHYRAVNEKFADAVCEEVDSDDPIILVQDYHFAVAPRLIRERLPRATIIMFWHIPWPNSQRFAICPWQKELLEGMLGASILGFHTQFDCNNFVDSVETWSPRNSWPRVTTSRGC
jgi:trehalose 6-phosphate synthase